MRQCGLHLHGRAQPIAPDDHHPSGLQLVAGTVQEQIDHVSPWYRRILPDLGPDFPEVAAHRLIQGASRDALRDRVHSSDASSSIRGDEAGADARQGDGQALLQVDHVLFGAAPLAHLGLQRIDGQLQ
jgi:hypothetical protein